MMTLSLPEKMAKGSRRLALGFLLLPLLYAAFLRSNIAPHRIWKLPLSHWPSSLSLRSDESSGINGGEHMMFLMRRLVRGKPRKELSQNGVACVSERETTFCLTSAAVRVTAGPSRKPKVYLTAGQNLSSYGGEFVVRPYPRRSDPTAMQRTGPVTLLPGGDDAPPCEVSHLVPAVVFSGGGYADNFFHSMNDVIIPLFLTAGHFRSRVKLVYVDYRPDWVEKYRRILAHLSDYDIVISSSGYIPVDTKVHCFPGAVVGLKYHDNIACNATDAPGVTTLDFKRFLREAFSLKRSILTSTTDEKPLLLLISRRKSRVLLNEEEVVQQAEEVGFRVEVAQPWRMKNVEEFAELVNSCSVLMGAHGAGMTNMVFLPSEAVVVQVVPFGLDWASKAYYGRGPTERLGLKYVEYTSAVEESTLYNKYPKDDPVLTDPWSIHRMGYNVSKPLYTDGQNLTVDISRIRQTLLQTLELLPRPSQL